MIQNIIEFIKKERLYLLLFLFLAIAYVYASSAGSQKQTSPAAANALQELRTAEEKMSNQMKDTASLKAYLEEHPEVALIFVCVAVAAVSLYFFGLLANILLLFKSSWRRRLSVTDDTAVKTDWHIAMIFKAAVLFMAFHLGVQALLFLCSLFFQMPENLLLLLQTTFDDIFCLFILIYLVKESGGSWRDLGLRVPSGNVFKEIFAGVLGYMCVFPIFITLLFLLVMLAHLFAYEPSSHPLVNIFLEEEKRSPLIIAYSVILATIIAPILEEIFFRGFCYPIFKRKWGKGWGMVITSVFFAAIHANLFAFLPIFILGMGLCYVYEKRGSLVAPMSLHLIHNSLFIGYFFLAKKVILMGS